MTSLRRPIAGLIVSLFTLGSCSTFTNDKKDVAATTQTYPEEMVEQHTPLKSFRSATTVVPMYSLDGDQLATLELSNDENSVHASIDAFNDGIIVSSKMYLGSEYDLETDAFGLVNLSDVTMDVPANQTNHFETTYYVTQDENKVNVVVQAIVEFNGVKEELWTIAPESAQLLSSKLSSHLLDEGRRTVHYAEYYMAKESQGVVFEEHMEHFSLVGGTLKEIFGDESDEQVAVLHEEDMADIPLVAESGVEVGSIHIEKNNRHVFVRLLMDGKHSFDGLDFFIGDHNCFLNLSDSELPPNNMDFPYHISGDHLTQYELSLDLNEDTNLNELMVLAELDGMVAMETMVP